MSSDGPQLRTTKVDEMTITRQPANETRSIVSLKTTELRSSTRGSFPFVSLLRTKLRNFTDLHVHHDSHPSSMLQLCCFVHERSCRSSAHCNLLERLAVSITSGAPTCTRQQYDIRSVELSCFDALRLVRSDCDKHRKAVDAGEPEQGGHDRRLSAHSAYNYKSSRPKERTEESFRVAPSHVRAGSSVGIRTAGKEGGRLGDQADADEAADTSHPFPNPEAFP